MDAFGTLIHVKKSQWLWIGTGAVVLALSAAVITVGPVIYRDWIAAPAASAPSLSPSDAGSTKTEGSADAPASLSLAVLDPAQLVGTWEVTDGSEAGYRVDEALNGTDVTVTGRTDAVTGTFTIGDDGLTLDDAVLTVDVASIATDQPQRDNYFRSQALHTDKFPEATFTLTTPVTLDSAPGAGEIVNTEASGDLTIAGVTHAVTAKVQLRSDGTTAEIAGSIPITFSDFGVEAPSLGFVQVAPEGAVEFQLTAARE